MTFLKLCSVLLILNAYIEFSHTLVVVTWDFPNATEAAWETILNKGSAIDAIEIGGSLCEELQCNKAVGFGGKPDENGETTLDALIMDGVTMDVGAVAGLRDIKDAISVARRVLENTEHSLIVGNQATDFAVKMGFVRESLQTGESANMWKDWRGKNCQPNFWKNVQPNSRFSCGPYRPIKRSAINNKNNIKIDENNHDTIGIIAIDLQGKIAAGTSTNGLGHKIPGRVGDSPIAGSGAYADQEVGAAAATGDGDVMMRFSPTFLAVELMRQGASPKAAAEIAVRRIVKHYPNFEGAIIALNKDHEYGVACNGLKKFPYYVASKELGGPTYHEVACL